MSTYSDRGPFPGRRNFGLARSLGNLPAPLSGVDLQLRLQGVMRLVDWLLIAVTGLAFDHLLGSPDRSPLAEALGIILVATITVNCLEVARAYGSRSMSCLGAQLGKVTMAWTSAFACVAAIAYLMDGSARLLGNATDLWFGASGILLLTSRLVASVLLARWQREGRLVRNIAVLGTGPAALALAEKLRAGKEEVNLVGVFADVGAANLPTGIDGNLDLLAARASSGLVDEIMLAMPWSSPVDLNRAITRFSNIQVEISISPALNELEYPPQGFATIAGVREIDRSTEAAVRLGRAGEACRRHRGRHYCVGNCGAVVRLDWVGDQDRQPWSDHLSARTPWFQQQPNPDVQVSQYASRAASGSECPAGEAQ